jgi:hypothetical protein
MTQTLEGTWEEIAARADEFKGHRVQLIVLDVPSGLTNGNGESQSLAEALTGKIGTVKGPPKESLLEIVERIGAIEGMPTDLSARAEEYFAEIMDEKYQKDLEKRKVAR